MTAETRQLRERLIRRTATLAVFAIPRPVCYETLRRNYSGMDAKELQRIAEGWRSVLRDSFAARLKALSDAQVSLGRR